MLLEDLPKIVESLTMTRMMRKKMIYHRKKYF